MADVMAYCDPQSAAPGETIRFMVSCVGAAEYRAEIVRLRSPQGPPDAPPFREEVVETVANGSYPGRRQEIQIGSWARVPASPLFNGLDSFTLQAMVWPTTPGRGRQALLGTWSAPVAGGVGLGLGPDGDLEVRLGDGAGGIATLASGQPLQSRRWYLVAASFDAGTGRLALLQRPLADKTFHAHRTVVTDMETGVRPAAGDGPFLFAAWRDDGPFGIGGFYNGKIDRPRLAGRALTPAEIEALAGDAIPAALADAVVAAWDFSRDIGGETIRDLSANRLDGETVNMPARAMTGCNWDGSEHDWTRAPGQYGAIHFHDDDLDDARWEADFSLTVPEDWPSGCYAARLRADGAEFHVPFFVRAPRGRATADVAYLAATATYTVYTNNLARFTGDHVELYQGRLTVMDETDMLLPRHPELGLSTYDRHSDGSGVCYSTRLRPATNVRPTGRLWNYCADLFIVDWLDRSGVGYDVITDEDLHRDGQELLDRYRVVVTGSHPEYDSKAMLDALDGWLRGGGRLMYLGGNGFYWRIAYHPRKPGLIEVRRSEGGLRAWIAEVGEYHHSFTGEYGGLWRRQNRAPNALCGVGFISQGFDASSHYRRTAASHDPRVAFMFAGIEDEILGDFGALQGGASGLELDCYDEKLGSPPHALIVAASEAHSNTYMLVPEEVAIPHGASDGVQNAGIRADMVFFETPGGGAVFSTGSIAYAGSLGHDDFDNNIARLTSNVLKRFVDATPFELPGAAS